MTTLSAAPAPPAETLLARLHAAAGPDAAIAAFEAGFHALPAYASAALFAEAARLYDSRDRTPAARLLRGMARQMQGGAPRPPLPAEAAAVLDHPLPATALLRRLEQLDREQAPEQAAALFEAVFTHMRPIQEYWVHFRMMQVYAALGRRKLAFLLACTALQIEPLARESLLPARTVLTWLMELPAWPQAGRLMAHWQGANPGETVLDPEQTAALLERAGEAAESPSARGRHDREVVAESVRPALTMAVYGRGVPYALVPLLQPEARPAIILSELEDAELLIADNAVAVWAADGTLQPDLSVGTVPSLIHRRLEERRRRGEPVDERELDRAVLIGDIFPAANICHFMLDQATRLPLYQSAAIELGKATVVGPDLERPFQRAIARRMGARRYLGTAGFGRVRVRRLAVLSNCRHLRHSAHLGAEWAIEALRAAFADVLADAQPARRLLVSRADVGTRRLVNEAEMFARLQPFGFERIVPGELPMADQARAFAAATHVVAAHGAALANLVFCAPGTQVLEIFHPHYGTYAYAMLAPALRLRYAAMVGRDGTSDAEADSDPAMASTRADGSLERHVRADLERLEAWARAGIR